jgi:RecA-family ATPase
MGNLKLHLLEVESRVRFRDPDLVLVNAVEFSMAQRATVEWILEGIIQAGGNGLIVGDGKVGKSLLAIHLLIHLAAGMDWLGNRVPRPIQTALISREDHPGETARRIASFLTALAPRLGGRTPEDRFWLNTRAQTETFSLQNYRDLQTIIEALKRRRVELAVFDVFRSLWTGDENDNQEVAVVLENLRTVQREAGCAVCLLHHLNKSTDAPSIFSRIRGGTAIRGWQEWGLAVQLVNPEDNEADWVRSIRFETKAARAHHKLHYAIRGPESEMRLDLAAPPETRRLPAKTITAIVPPRNPGMTAWRKEEKE